MSDSTQAQVQLPPHSAEAEEGVIGSILINAESLFDVLSFIKPEDFFILRNRRVYQAILSVHERGEAIDNITVVEELRAQTQLDDIGGAAYITYLINSTPTHIHAETYGRIVERAAVRRRLLKAANEIAQAAMQENSDIDEVVGRAEASMLEATQRKTKRDLYPLNLALREYFDHIEYLYNHQDEPLGVPSDFTDLDGYLGGFQRSDLIIVAARPGMGKTSFLLNVAMNAARRGKRVAIFSLEMSREQIVQRFVSSETGIPSHKLRMAALEDHQWSLFIEATGRLDKLKVFIDDTPAITIPQLRTKCRRLYAEEGLDLVIVDYLQLMTAAMYGDNRVQEVSAISRGLKELAKELNVPLISAAQLSRAVEQRSDKRPQLSDLRESGSIEMDADIVLFLYRDDVYNEMSERPNQADVIIAKHRNGPTGVTTLFYRKELMTFVNMAKSNINLGDFR
jgi:replicative DNA helicase